MAGRFGGGMDRIIPYCGPSPAPSDLLWAWNVSLLPLAIAVAPLLAAMAAPRIPRGPALVAALALVLAFVSPLCALTTALFSARSVHHLVLMLLAAPALAVAFASFLPKRSAAVSLAGFAGLSVFLWLWHVPSAYALAWESLLAYWLMQAGLLGSAVLFWSGVLTSAPTSAELRLGAVAQLLGLAGQMGLLGAILTFAPRLLYPEHLTTTAGYGLDPMADQQMAGLIMWVPGMLPLAAFGAMLLRRGWREALEA